jgi:HAD superfamily hydrolase (TIGR01509 family)
MSRPVCRRAVVFDLDGTLVDSLPLVLASISHALAPFGSRAAADILARLGGPPERFLLTLLDDAKNLPVALERLGAFHDENVHLVRPYEGVTACLTRLRAAGVPAALWTGRDRPSAEWLLREHHLEHFFATVVCGDDLGSNKPNPEGLREIMRRLQVAPDETLFVGDADVDVLGGVGCGVDTLLIRHAREIEVHIASQSWRTVLSPREAYDLVIGCVETVAEGNRTSH